MKSLDYIIAEYMLEVLEAHKWNKTNAAAAMGVSLRTLRNWIPSIQAMDNGELKEDFDFTKDRKNIQPQKRCPTCFKPSSELWRGYCHEHWMKIKRSIQNDS